MVLLFPGSGLGSSWSGPWLDLVLALALVLVWSYCSRLALVWSLGGSDHGSALLLVRSCSCSAPGNGSGSGPAAMVLVLVLVPV